MNVDGPLLFIRVLMALGTAAGQGMKFYHRRKQVPDPERKNQLVKLGGWPSARYKITSCG